MLSAATSAPVITRPRAQPPERPVNVMEFDVGHPTYVPTEAAAEALSVALEATLLALDEQNNLISALPVHFRSRVTVGSTATLVGTDDSGAVRVIATVTTNPLALKLSLRYLAGGTALPRQLLASVRFLRALRLPNRVGFNIGDRAVGEAVEVPSDADVPQDFLELVRSLAFVQMMAGTAFALSPDLDDDDLRALREAEALLRGETVSARWSEATLGLSTIDSALLAVVEGGAPFRLDFVAPLTAQIADHEVPLGDARYVFRVAVIENYDELLRASETGDIAGADARLRPGADDGYEVRLIAPPELGFNHQAVRPPLVVARADLDAAKLNPLRRDAFRSALP